MPDILVVAPLETLPSAIDSKRLKTRIRRTILSVVRYGPETWLFTFREEYEFQISENRRI
jgi:hypothetical protein